MLAGDTMLGRGVGEHLATYPPSSVVAPEVRAVAREADLVLCNLECCISARGEPWADPAKAKAFFFRAPPQAVGVLQALGTTCVTLANNHALDYGYDALGDTCAILGSAGIAWVGAGPDEHRARAPTVLTVRGVRVAVAGVADHPPDFAAGADRPGIAYADLRVGVPGWLRDVAASARPGAVAAPDAVVVLAHWGPNMVRSPVPHVRRAATTLVAAGATLVAGTSAHVFHGVSSRVLYDLGDFVDDYATDPMLRNDLGLLWVVDLGPDGPVRIEAVPLRLHYARTHLATGEDWAWIARRFRAVCAAHGTDVTEASGRLVIDTPGGGPPLSSPTSSPPNGSGGP